uniref:mRNA (guanine-N(7))-methyltransferase n=1 Tax=viral metagenome TaxID=1070528 RepID=A0A6C0D798_9ZZZZ
MELSKKEVESIKRQIQNWIDHPDHELECTFGKGTVDATTFFQVAQRLRSKNMRELSQEDRLTITTPEHVRFTIQSMGVIQQYCRDDSLLNKPFVAMIKDRSSAEANVDIEQYDVRIKTRREIPMANNEIGIKDMLTRWPTQRKAFRMIRRWSFEEPGIRYDLSIVRSSARTQKGEFKWQQKFLDQDLSLAPYLYEMEVELLRMENDTVESAIKRIIKGVGEILRGIQKNSVLITKSKKEKVIQEYESLTKANRFLGCSPVTLEQPNFSEVIDEAVPNIRTGYNVTDKADGLRCLGFTDSDGEFYLIDMGMNVYRTGLSCIENRETIIDGEWVTKTSKKQPINIFMAFDIYYATDGNLVSKYPFYNKDDEEKSRHSILEKWVKTFNAKENPKKLLSYLTSQITVNVSMKTFIQARANDLSIFKTAAKVLDTYRVYYTDGLIFTPNTLPLPGYDEERKTIKPGATFYHQFKWKPSEDNTIDFLVRFEKVPNNPKQDKVVSGIKPETNETVRYKTMRLYVGSSRNKAFNPRDMILNERVEDRRQNRNEYRPVLFHPKQYFDEKASVSYGEIKFDPATSEEYVSTELNNEPIQDKSIIEMRYDPTMAEGWRWIPIRIRHDKTERLQKGVLARTLNSEDVADSVWNSIHDPVTESMIRSGNTNPNHAEVNSTMKKIEQRDNISLKYFERKAPQKDLLFVRGLREFHNQYIKEIVLYNTVLKGGNKTLLDIAVGKGSDIRRWVNNKVSFVLGIDYAGDNITNTEDGAYARYITFKQKNRRVEVPPMIFVIGDGSKRIIDGNAGSSAEESDILRSVYGRFSPVSSIPPYVSREAANKLKEGADTMACMFALHYFFEKKETLDGLLKNIRECLKVGGYFFGCCFDGDSVFDMFKDTSKGGVLTGMEKDAILWNIRKDYDIDELEPNDSSLGHKINVDFISIGNPHDEYLVSFSYFVERMKEVGCELLNETQANALGLKNSTNMFGTSYDMAKQFGKNYIMSDSVKKFSFLNRWFIFVKSRDIVPEVVSEEEFVPITKSKKTMKLATPTVQAVAQVLEKNSEPERIVVTKNQTPENLLTREEENVVEAVKEDTAERTHAKTAAAAAERTIPVELGTAAPVRKAYASNQVFNFFFDAQLDDKLKIGDKESARYISPQTPFRIKDTDDPSIVYPSIEHFMAAMVYKYGTTNPDLAKTLFSREGTIHQAYLRRRKLETKDETVPLSYDKDHELINEEINDIKAELRHAAFKKYKVVYNESNYLVKKDELLRKAVEQRYKKDERMRKILEGARKAGKYLLYYTKSSIKNLGGMRKTNGTIEGDNKLGRLYMELAGFTE